MFSVDTVQNTIIDNSFFPLQYILSILNSKLISLYAYKFIYCSAIRTMHFDKYYLGKIPIKQTNKQCVFEELVSDS
ncbi:MAG: TaqI-like C-terminal specificity domain-containing protein [Candidatus Cloacimonadota bacterium]|nr:TaqI-like C-terminal specificity domain-containing protein [Candidatus Cloacimonadota bacterium]